jgi:hypothetical protein
MSFPFLLRRARRASRSLVAAEDLPPLRADSIFFWISFLDSLRVSIFELMASISSSCLALFGLSTCQWLYLLIYFKKKKIVRDSLERKEIEI